PLAPPPRTVGRSWTSFLGQAGGWGSWFCVVGCDLGRVPPACRWAVGLNLLGRGYDMLCPGCSYNPECSCCQDLSLFRGMNRQLRWLPYLFAAGAVLWLVELTRFAAYLVAPAGREVLKQALIDGGITRNLDATLTTES